MKVNKLKKFVNRTYSRMFKRLVFFYYTLLILPVILILFVYFTFSLDSIENYRKNLNDSNLTVLSKIVEKNSNINNKELTDYFNLLFNTEINELYIFNKEDNLIWERGKIPNRNSNTDLELGISNINRLSENGTYLINTVEDLSNSFDYYLISDSNGIMMLPIKIKRLQWILIIAILFFSLITLYIFIVVNYIPVKKLRIFVEDRLGIKISHGDEIKAIKDAINIYSEDVNEFKISSINASNDYILPKLMHGEYRSVSEFNKEGRAFNMYIKGGGFRVLLLSFIKGVDFSETRFLSILDDFSINKLPGFYKYDYHKSSVEYICNFSGKLSSKQVLKNFLDNMQNDMDVQADAKMTIGVGEACRDIKDIGRSTIQAQTCMDYRIIKGENEIIFFEDFDHEQQADYWYSRHYIQDLELLIREGNSIKSEALMKNYIDHIRENRYPMFIAKCLCYDIVNTIGHIIQDVNLPELETSKESIWSDLESFNSIDNLALILVNFSKEIGKSLKKNKSGKSSETSVKTKNYIDEHLFDSDFYLQKLADDFSQSLPYLSQSFKKTYGITMIDYISRIRMKKAESLLAETSMKVSEIVIEVGYSDRSSFSKKFKAQSGLSPNEFRKMNRENKLVKFASS